MNFTTPLCQPCRACTVGRDTVESHLSVDGNSNHLHVQHKMDEVASCLPPTSNNASTEEELESASRAETNSEETQTNSEGSPTVESSGKSDRVLWSEMESENDMDAFDVDKSRALIVVTNKKLEVTPLVHLRDSQTKKPLKEFVRVGQAWEWTGGCFQAGVDLVPDLRLPETVECLLPDPFNLPESSNWHKVKGKYAKAAYRGDLHCSGLQLIELTQERRDQLQRWFKDPGNSRKVRRQGEWYSFLESDFVGVVGMTSELAAKGRDKMYKILK